MTSPATPAASPCFSRTETRILMPRLVGTHPIDVKPRFLHFFLAPFCVSLVLSLVSEVIPKHWQGIAVAAVSGQMAMTLMKLFWYIGIFLLSVAAAAKSVPRIGKNLAYPFRWVGNKLAEVAFDYTSGAIGVIAGIGPAVAIEHHIQGVWQIGSMLMVMLLAQFLMWGFANLAASNFDNDVPKPIFIWLGAIAFAGIAVYGFYKEPWIETHKGCTPIHATPASSSHPRLIGTSGVITSDRNGDRVRPA